MKSLPISIVLAGASLLAAASGCSKTPGNKNTKGIPDSNNNPIPIQQAAPVPQTIPVQQTKAVQAKAPEPQKFSPAEIAKYRADRLKIMEEALVIALCSRAYTNAFLLRELVKDDSYEAKDEAKKLLELLSEEERKFYNLGKSQRLVNSYSELTRLIREAANDRERKDAFYQMILLSRQADTLITKFPRYSSTTHDWGIEILCTPVTGTDITDRLSDMFLGEAYDAYPYSWLDSKSQIIEIKGYAEQNKKNNNYSRVRPLVAAAGG